MRSRLMDEAARLGLVALVVLAVLPVYFDHIGEIQNEMREARAFAEEFRRSYPSLLEAKLRRERLEEAS